MHFLFKMLFLFGLALNAALAQINLNTATLEELQSIKGIGIKKAKNIIEYREKNGAFQSLDDLKNVKGFEGNNFFEALKQYLNVGESSNSGKNITNLFKKDNENKEEKSLLKTLTQRKSDETDLKTEIKKEITKKVFQKILE